jgi:hypothetical protein
MAQAQRLVQVAGSSNASRAIIPATATQVTVPPPAKHTVYVLNDDSCKEDKRPVLHFGWAAWTKLQFLLHTANTEFTFFCYCPTDPFLVEDILIPPQRCSQAFTNPDDMSVFQGVMAHRGYRLEHWRHNHWHTHPNMSATPSGTDEDTYKDLVGGDGAGNFPAMFIYGIISKTNDITCRCATHTPYPSRSGTIRNTRQLAVHYFTALSCPVIARTRLIPTINFDELLKTFNELVKNFAPTTGYYSGTGSAVGNNGGYTYDPNKPSIFTPTEWEKITKSEREKALRIATLLTTHDYSHRKFRSALQSCEGIDPEVYRLARYRMFEILKSRTPGRIRTSFYDYRDEIDSIFPKNWPTTYNDNAIKALTGKIIHDLWSGDVRYTASAEVIDHTTPAEPNNGTTDPLPSTTPSDPGPTIFDPDTGRPLILPDIPVPLTDTDRVDRSGGGAVSKPPVSPNLSLPTGRCATDITSMSKPDDDDLVTITFADGDSCTLHKSDAVEFAITGEAPAAPLRATALRS